MGRKLVCKKSLQTITMATLTKKELLETIGELLDDKRIKTTIENCQHFDACYNIRDKILKIQFYDDKRGLT